MPNTTPNLTIELTLAEQQLLRDFTNFARKLEQRASANQTKLEGIQDQGEAKRIQSNKNFQQKQEQAEKTHQEKLRRLTETNLQKQIIANQNAQTKILRSTNTWSAKMAKGFGAISAAIKTMAVAYATAFVGQAFKGAVEMIATMGNVAASVGLTANQLLALRYAANNANVGFEQVTAILTKLNIALGDTTGKFDKVVADLGLNRLATTEELFDAIIARVRELSTVTAQIDFVRQFGIAEENAARFVRLANGIKSVGDATEQLGIKITPQDVANANKLAATIDAMFLKIQAQLGKGLVNEEIIAFVEKLTTRIQKIDFEAVINGILKLLELLGKFGTEGGPQAIVAVKGITAALSGLSDVFSDIAKISKIAAQVLGGNEGLVGITTKVNALQRAIDGLDVVPPQMLADLAALQGEQRALGEALGEANAAFKTIKTNMSPVARLIWQIRTLLNPTIQRIQMFAGWILKGGSALFKLLTPLKAVFVAVGKLSVFLTAVFMLWDFVKALTAGNNIIVSVLYSLGKFFTAIFDLVGLIGSFIPGWQKFWSAPGRWLDDMILGNDELERTTEIMKEWGKAFSAPSGKSPVDIALEQANKAGEDASRAFKVALAEELDKRRERIDALNNEIDILKNQVKWENLSREAMVLVTEELEKRVEELNKLFDVKPAEKSPLVQWLEDIRKNTLTIPQINQRITALLNAIGVGADPAVIKAYNDELESLYELLTNIGGVESTAVATSILPTDRGSQQKAFDFLKNYRNEVDETRATINTLSMMRLRSNVTDAEDKALEGEIERLIAKLRELLGVSNTTLSNASFVNALGLNLSAEWTQVLQNAIGSMTQLFEANAIAEQNNLQVVENAIELERRRWDERSELLRKAGLESSVFYRNESRKEAAAEKQRLARQRAAQSKAWEAEQQAAITNAYITMAQAILNALLVKPFFPVGLAMSVLAGALARKQISAIQAQQNPYSGPAFAMGGIVPGNSFADQTLVRTTPGEAVIPRSTVAENEEVINDLLAGRSVSGGPNINITITGDVIGDQEYVNNKLAPRLEKAVRDGWLSIGK